jgi:hypothetical protein
MEEQNIYQLPPNSNSMESMLDEAIIKNTTPQGYVPTGYEKSMMDAYATALSPNEIGQQGIGSLYPGIGEDIRVGSVSGRFGSDDIFVPTGNILPIDPILARRKAIDDAAKKRALSMIERPALPDLKKFKDSGFDEKLNKDMINFHETKYRDAYEKFGPAASQMLKNDPEYIQGMANFDHIVRNVDRITDLVTNIESGLKDGSIAVTDEGMKEYQKYKKMLGDFTDYGTLTSTDMRQIESKLGAIQDINNYLNDEKLLSTIKAQVTSTFGTRDKGMYYNSVTNKKTSYKDVINDLTNSLAESTTFKYGIENGFYTKEDLKAALDARLKDQQEISGTMSQKSEWSVNDGRGWDVPDPNDRNAFVTYSTDNKGNVSVRRLLDDGKTEDVEARSLADYNTNVLGEKRKLTVQDTKGELTNVDIRGLQLNDVIVYTRGGGQKKIPGQVYTELGEMSLLEDGTVVHKAKVYKPVVIPRKEKGKESTQTTYQMSEELVVVRNPNGTGNSTSSQVKTQLKSKGDNKVKNYENAETKMQNVRNKSLQPNYSSGQEANIEATMKANPGASREEVIKALGY